MKKILVTKEWHVRAMAAIKSQNENAAFIEGLQMFLCTKLSPEQQNELEKEVQEWMERYDA